MKTLFFLHRLEVPPWHLFIGKRLLMIKTDRSVSADECEDRSMP